MSDGKTRRYMNEREWQCFEDGVKYERERLIKLLEETYNGIIDEVGISLAKNELDLLLQLIALIKGEK